MSKNNALVQISVGSATLSCEANKVPTGITKVECADGKWNGRLGACIDGRNITN